jgi:hypothetical protein
VTPTRSVESRGPATSGLAAAPRAHGRIGGLRRHLSRGRRYHALRVCPKALSSEWWIAASARRGAAPRPVQALLGGRTRVEISAEEAVLAIDWAAQLSGWDDHDLPPIFVYPPLAAGDG